MQNSTRQSNASTSTPPSAGPAAAATAADALQRPIAAVRRAGGVSASTNASDAGIISAAPTPCTARAASRTPKVGASAASSDATVNVVTPATNRRRRPTTSASRPAGASSAANRIVYSVTTQDSDVTPTEKSAPRSGTARFVIVTSRKARKAPPHASSRGRRDEGSAELVTGTRVVGSTELVMWALRGSTTRRRAQVSDRSFVCQTIVRTLNCAEH